MNKLQVGWLALGALMVAPIIAAPVMRADPYDKSAAEMAQLRAWKLSPSVAESLTEGHRLVGLGCGHERLTMTAAEESDFPSCDTIETPARLCPADEGDEPLAWECAAYMGEGW